MAALAPTHSWLAPTPSLVATPVHVCRPPPPSPKPPRPRPPPPAPPPSPPPPPPVGNVFELITLNMSMGLPQGFVYCGCGWVTGLLTGSVTLNGRQFLSTLGVVCRWACCCSSCRRAHQTVSWITHSRCRATGVRVAAGRCPAPAQPPPNTPRLPPPRLLAAMGRHSRTLRMPRLRSRPQSPWSPPR